MATAKENMELLENLLDEYEQKLGLPKFVEDNKFNDVEGYLSYTRDQLDQLAPDVANEISFRLVSYAIYLGRAYNREISRQNWAKSEIDNIIGPKLNNYTGYGYKEKFPAALADDEYAMALEEIRQYSVQRSDRLNYVSSNINKLADTLRNIAQSKMKMREG